MAFNYPNIAADALDTWLNGLLAKLKSVINAFPGANIVNSSVTLNKLAKQKARGTWSFSRTDVLGAANRLNIFSRTILNSDAAAADYKIVGWSVSVNNDVAGTAFAAATDADIKVYRTGVLILTIPFDTGTALAIGTPLSSDLSGAPITFASGGILTVDYVWAAGACTYPSVQLHLDYTLPHAGT
jgi:hypothetical protein